jgi:YHS domain-containing protein
MQVEKAQAPATAPGPDGLVYFCSERCRDRYVGAGHDAAAAGAAPRSLHDTTHGPSPGAAHGPLPDAHRTSPDTEGGGGVGTGSAAVDPVCGMTVDPSRAAAHRSTGEGEYWFCSAGCADAFDRRLAAQGRTGPPSG